MKIIKFMRIMGILGVISTLLLMINSFFTKGLPLVDLLDYLIIFGASIYLINPPQKLKDKITLLFGKPKE